MKHNHDQLKNYFWWHLKKNILKKSLKYAFKLEFLKSLIIYEELYVDQAVVKRNQI